MYSVKFGFKTDLKDAPSNNIINSFISNNGDCVSQYFNTFYIIIFANLFSTKKDWTFLFNIKK